MLSRRRNLSWQKVLQTLDFRVIELESIRLLSLCSHHDNILGEVSFYKNCLPQVAKMMKIITDEFFFVYRDGQIQVKCLYWIKLKSRPYW